MKHLFTRILLVAVAILLGYGEGRAFDNNKIYFLSSITNWNWDSKVHLVDESYYDGNKMIEKFSTEFDLSAGNTVEFKFYVEDNFYGENYGWLGCEIAFGNNSMVLNMDYWGSKKFSSEANNFRFTATSDFSKYKVTLTYDNAGDDYKGYWRIRIIPIRNIDLRDYADVKYTKSDNTVETRIIKGRGNYIYFCTWSDEKAWVKPDNIDMFVVSGYTAPSQQGGTASITLTKLNPNDYDYIPAHTGLILAAKNRSSLGIISNRGDNGTTFNLLTEKLYLYEDDDATYSGTSLLKTCDDATPLPRFETIDGTECANYLFGFYRSKKAGFTDVADNEFALGFWLSSGNGNTYANSAYFQIPKDEAELIGVGTSYDMTNSSSAKPCFLLDFSEEDDVTTGISDASHLYDHEQMINDKGGWYTLDGRRLDGQPTAKGIYICNGKKFIMK